MNECFGQQTEISSEVRELHQGGKRVDKRLGRQETWVQGAQSSSDKASSVCSVYPSSNGTEMPKRCPGATQDPSEEEEFGH